MSLQKYRADSAGPTQSDGAIPFYTNWMGGPSLALIRNCRIENAIIPARTVYVQGEADTFFSIPAACRYKGKNVYGYITTDDKREYVFRADLTVENLKLIPFLDAKNHDKAVQLLRTNNL